MSEAMDSPQDKSVLRRKATAAKEVWQARAMSPAKALRLSIARAADDLWDLAAAASGIALAEESLETAVASIPDDGMILLLDGPDGLVGAAYLPFAIVVGLIEVQTIGRVGSVTGETRRVTRTDAAMVSPLIDGMLDRFDRMLEEGDIAPWARGYRFGTMMESSRMLTLALKATDFHVMRFSLDLAARREGEALLMMPVANVATMSPQGQEGQGTGDGALGAQILQAPTELRAVLHRVSMPLSAVSALRVGDVIEIPRDALSVTEVEVGTQTVIGTTRLGQVNGMRAVRLTMAGLPEPASPVVGATGPSSPPPVSPVAAPELRSLPMTTAAEPEPEAKMPPPAPMPRIEGDDLLGDLPDLGDLPGMAGDNGEELPDIGMMPMAALPVID